MTVQDIMAPISTEMSEFEGRFRESMRSKVPMLNKVTHYIYQRTLEE